MVEYGTPAHVSCVSASVQYLSVSFVNQHVVKLFIFPAHRSEGGVLFGYFFERCIERCTVLKHQPLFHPDATFVGFLHCMLMRDKTTVMSALSRMGQRGWIKEVER